MRDLDEHRPSLPKVIQVPETIRNNPINAWKPAHTNTFWWAHETQKPVSIEAVTDITLPAKKTKTEKRKEMTFNLFSTSAFPTALTSHSVLKMQVVATKPVFDHLHYRKEEK